MSELAVGELPVARSVSNTEDVYVRLRAMLLNGELLPGTILSQVKLARQLEVSTTPLREAMRLLQAEGLLIAEHNRRSRVAPLDPKDIDAVYASRIMMEALAIRLTVPGLQPADIEALRTDLDRMASAGEVQDLSTWEPLHADFHRRLTNGCDEQMTRIIESVSDHTERYRRSSLFGSPVRTWEIGNQEHEAIVDACEAGKPDEASILLARHLARSALTVLAKVSPESNPLAVREALKMVQRASA
ncbi:MAG: GntR family transcriptional regulator [Microbacteriaceae bacterium]